MVFTLCTLALGMNRDGDAVHEEGACLVGTTRPWWKPLVVCVFGAKSTRLNQCSGTVWI